MTTIYEIAKEAGVSASTVSRVLNKKSGVSKGTCEKVLEVAKRRNFSLNETARGLVSKSTKMIGILLQDLRTTHHSDGIYYIQQELDRLGYCCIIMNTGYEDSEKARYIRILKQRRVEAAVLMGSNFESDAIKDAIREYIPDIPVFIANGYIDLPNVYGVIADERDGVRKCAELLKQKGRQRIIFLNGNDTPSNRQKVLGFLDECGDEGAVFGPCGDYESTKEEIEKALQKDSKVDGVICVDDPVAIEALRIFADKGMSVPSDISVIGINNSKLAETSIPRLSSLDNMLLELNLTTARSIVDVIKGRHVAKKVMICSSIVERETT